MIKLVRKTSLVVIFVVRHRSVFVPLFVDRISFASQSMTLDIVWFSCLWPTHNRHALSFLERRWYVREGVTVGQMQRLEAGKIGNGWWQPIQFLAGRQVQMVERRERPHLVG
jgi:hypothetical protein